jgi:hypothetical protein
MRVERATVRAAEHVAQGADAPEYDLKERCNTAAHRAVTRAPDLCQFVVQPGPQSLQCLRCCGGVRAQVRSQQRVELL